MSTPLQTPCIDSQAPSPNRDDWRQSTRQSLATEQPALHQLVSAIIESHRYDRRVCLEPLTDRLLRASQLLLAGSVTRSPSHSLVTSQRNPEVSYRITWQGLPLRPSCTCADFTRGGVFSHYGPVCKHILADLLSYFLGSPSTTCRLPVRPGPQPTDPPQGEAPQPEPPAEQNGSTPSKTIWEMVVDLIERQKIALRPGQEHPLWQNGHSNVSLRRRPTDDRLVLIARNGHLTTSKPIAYWGTDVFHISGRRGRWLLTDEARANYETFVAQAQR